MWITAPLPWLFSSERKSAWISTDTTHALDMNWNQIQVQTWQQIYVLQMPSNVSSFCFSIVWSASGVTFYILQIPKTVGKQFWHQTRGKANTSCDNRSRWFALIFLHICTNYRWRSAAAPGVRSIDIDISKSRPSPTKKTTSCTNIPPFFHRDLPATPPPPTP